MARQLSSHTLSLLAVIAGVSAGLVTKARASDESLVQQRANAVVSLMSYAVVPDITASNLNIGSGTNDTSALTITQLGGGATLSEDVPLYLEGTLGYSRYDPQFVFTDGNETRTIPTKWNSLSATGGIGWDVGVHRDRFGGNLVLRPIANVTLGTVASDLRIGAALLEHRTGLACGDYLRAIEGLNRFRGLYLGFGRLAEAYLVEETRPPTRSGRLKTSLLRFFGSMSR